MPECIVRGEPLGEVLDPLRGTAPRAAIIVIIDGCRADTLYGALHDGKMPHLKRLMDDVGFVRYENCFTVFPSVTITCHASIVTGTYPGAHGIIGNDWFIRKKWGSHIRDRGEFLKVTREYVKFSCLDHQSDPGLANGLVSGGYFAIANADMHEEVRTLYEAHNIRMGSPLRSDKSKSIYEMITRGVAYPDYIDTDDGVLLPGVLKSVYWSARGRSDLAVSHLSRALDSAAMRKQIGIIGDMKAGRYGISVAWLSGVDGFGHKRGASRQREYIALPQRGHRAEGSHFDHQFALLRAELEKHRILKDVLLVITADHGQYDCGGSDGSRISNADLYRHLISHGTIGSREKFPLTPDGGVDDHCKDASIVVMGNGGACHVYVRAASGDWSERPGLARLDGFVDALRSCEGVDQILVRADDGRYRIWDAKERMYREPSRLLDTHVYPFANERVNGLACTEHWRAGDIVLSAADGHYFAEKTMAGEHGSLRREDSHVPLIFIHGCLGKTNEARDIRVIDIAPTVAEAMGCVAELRQKGTKYDKLTAILDVMESQRGSVPYNEGDDAVFGRAGRLMFLQRIVDMWNAEGDDMRDDVAAKMSRYRQDGQLTSSQYEDLKARYESLVGELLPDK
ncbi:MAG: alkaline phosphatase family protein [Candidatus Eisenbacteria bacterium]